MSRSDVAGTWNATDEALTTALADMAAGRLREGESGLMAAITPLAAYLAQRYRHANADAGLEVEDLVSEGQMVVLALARRLAVAGKGWPTDLPRVTAQRYLGREMQRSCDRARQDWAGPAYHQQRRRSAGLDRLAAPVNLDGLIQVPAA